MKNTLLLATTSLLLLIMTIPVFAIRIDTLYSAKVPVNTQSAQERDASMPQAIEQVLIKVSGNKQIINNPALTSRIKTDNNLIQEFSYTNVTGSKQPFLLKLRFDNNMINQWLRDASAPIWSQNRPLVLSLITFTVTGHAAEVLSSPSLADIPPNNLLKENANNHLSSNMTSNDLSNGNATNHLSNDNTNNHLSNSAASNGLSSDTANLFVKYAEQRGLPLIFPLMDESDLTQITTQDIDSRQVTPTLNKAAARYGSDALLLGSVTQQTDDQLSSHWKLMLGTEQWEWNFTGKSIEDIASAIVDAVTDTLAARYAIVTTNQIQNTIRLKVIGVNQQSDFVQLIRYLNHLPPVADVSITEITGNQILLTISLRSTQQSFIRAITLGKQLTPIPATGIETTTKTAAAEATVKPAVTETMKPETTGATTTPVTTDATAQSVATEVPKELATTGTMKPDAPEATTKPLTIGAPAQSVATEAPKEPATTGTMKPEALGATTKPVTIDAPAQSAEAPKEPATAGTMKSEAPGATTKPVTIDHPTPSVTTEAPKEPATAETTKKSSTTETNAKAGAPAAEIGNTTLLIYQWNPS